MERRKKLGKVVRRNNELRRHISTGTIPVQCKWKRVRTYINDYEDIDKIDRHFGSHMADKLVVKHDI